MDAGGLMAASVGTVALSPGSRAAPPGVALTVVLPVYNEQDILATTVAAITTALGPAGLDTSFELLLCDNGSTDDSGAIARACAARDPRVRVLRSPRPDYGAALRDGFRAARGEWIVNFDADYYEFGFLAQALALDADVVVAAKGLPGSQDARVLLRRVVSRSFSRGVRLALHLSTSETHGMKLFRRASVAPLVDVAVATKDLFDTEVVARAEWTGLQIAELPITTVEMRHSRSGILRRIPRTCWGLLALRRRLRQDYGRPALPGPRAVAPPRSRTALDHGVPHQVPALPLPGQRQLPRPASSASLLAEHGEAGRADEGGGDGSSSSGRHAGSAAATA